MQKLLQSQENCEEFLKGYADYTRNFLKEQNQQIIDIASDISKTFNALKDKITNTPVVLEKSRYSLELLEEPKGETVMKGITLRNDGRYMIRKTINGVAIVKYAHTKEEARQIYIDIKRGKIKPKKKEKSEVTNNKNITINDYSKKWLETYKKPFLQPKNYSSVKCFIARFTKELGEKRIKEITTEEIQLFFNKLTKGITKEKIYIYVNSLFQTACDTGVINRNPAKTIIKDKNVKCKSDMYVYDEQVKIINAIKGSDIEHEIMT